MTKREGRPQLPWGEIVGMHIIYVLFCMILAFYSFAVGGLAAEVWEEFFGGIAHGRVVMNLGWFVITVLKTVALLFALACMLCVTGIAYGWLLSNLPYGEWGFEGKSELEKKFGRKTLLYAILPTLIALGGLVSTLIKMRKLVWWDMCPLGYAFMGASMIFLIVVYSAWIFLFWGFAYGAEKSPP